MADPRFTALVAAADPPAVDAIRRLGATLPPRARAVAELLALRLGHLDPAIPAEVAAAVLEGVAAALDGVADGLPPDDDALDVHRASLRSLAPFEAGPEGSEPAGSEPTEGAADDGFLLVPRASGPDAPPTPDADTVALFQVEAQELLAVCEAALLALESDPDDPAPLHELFRALHSFKGNCGFLGFRDLEHLSHEAETLLVRLKEGRRAFDERAANALIGVVDALRRAVAGSTPHVPAPGFDPLLAELAAILAAPDAPAPEPASPPAPIPTANVPPEVAPLADRPESAPPRAEEAEARSARTSETTLRVDVAKVEALLDLVGELVIAQTGLRHLDVTGPASEPFGRAYAQLDRVARGLQDAALALRMVPVGPLFRRMFRVARDVAQRLGKTVEVALDGEDTEIDKSVAELLVDPLVHLVRNAVDHGIEAPGTRQAAGKPPVGRLRLSGAQVGGEVHIRLEDDGRGLDRARILGRAVERGLVRAEDGAALPDSDVFAFVFEPGFSTADRVTDVSGRGVGLDVVTQNLAQVKGRVEIQSRPGEGAAFVLRIPLTLAIVEGMLVRVGTDSFTVPLLHIRESVKVRPGDVTRLPTGVELVRIRGELLPVVRLHEAFDLPPEHRALPDGILLVVEDGSAVAALFVDQLVGQRQTVIKAVSGFLGQVRGVAGCTVLGDGRISLVLDVAALAGRASRASAAPQA